MPSTELARYAASLLISGASARRKGTRCMHPFIRQQQPKENAPNGLDLVHTPLDCKCIKADVELVQHRHDYLGLNLQQQPEVVSPL